MKKYTSAFVFVLAFLLIGCQTTQFSTNPTTKTHLDHNTLKFAATGKIGITMQTDEGKQGGSAFYAWAQEDERFSIDLTGALGLGAAQIRYDGREATLNSERTGLIQAATPEDLLFQASNWQAPISQLAYWIVGHASPSDDKHEVDSIGRITQATNGPWSASFDYNKGNLPQKITILHLDGHRVVLTISHQ